MLWKNKKTDEGNLYPHSCAEEYKCFNMKGHNNNINYSSYICKALNTIFMGAIHYCVLPPIIRFNCYSAYDSVHAPLPGNYSVQAPFYKRTNANPMDGE